MDAHMNAKEESSKASSSKGGGTKGTYLIIKTLGKGNYAIVKLAVHIPTGRKVAVKIINKTKLDAKHRQKIYREVQLMRLLNHPNILELLHVFESQNSFYLVMEYAPRGDLLDYLADNGPLQEREARKFFRQIVSALHYCHSKFVVHRDLKAENMLLDKNLNIKIADFGLACIYNSNVRLNTFCGTISYAAPEMLKGLQYIGPEIDVWSLGVVLYVLIVGKLPFIGKTHKALMENILRGEFSLPFYISLSCQKLLRKLLKLDPTKRSLLHSILNDKWINLGCEQLRPYKEQPKELDPIRVQQMVALGYKQLEIEASFKTKRFDDIYCSYQLLGLPGINAKEN